ncbi:2,5-diketo-D-gluconic acid reductase B [bacterium HR40]|nr:2,5-diketo-D-gluconic acid reductase B [bacterium HR40]
MIVVEAHGARIPALGLGTWELAGALCERIVELALAIGYRHFDTAQMYGNEREVGRAIAKSGIARAEVFVTTKIWPDSFRRGTLQAAAAASVERLGLVPDLLLLHWPNPNVPLAETMEALVDARARGFTRHIGISNFPTRLMAEAISLSPVPLVTNQVEYHPFLSQRRVLAACRDAGMALTAYCPLARGRVFGHPVLRRIASRHGKNEGQVALRWLLQQPMVAAVPRSARPEHLRANFEVFDFTLSEAEMAEIAALADPRGRVVDIDGLAPPWDPE